MWEGFEVSGTKPDFGRAVLYFTNQSMNGLVVGWFPNVAHLFPRVRGYQGSFSWSWSQIV